MAVSDTIILVGRVSENCGVLLLHIACAECIGLRSHLEVELRIHSLLSNWCSKPALDSLGAGKGLQPHAPEHYVGNTFPRT